MYLPNNSAAFKTIVIEKVKTYCDTNIWPYSFEQFAAWLNNFDDDLEEYLALQIIDNLIVRSNNMAKSAYARLFNSKIRQFLLENTEIKTGTLQNWRSHLKNGTLSNDIRFTPVRLENDLGESGSVIYRLLSPEIHTDRYSFKKDNAAPKVLILIDDFIGSGTQFDEYASEINLSKLLLNSIVLYCPLIAFENGIRSIKSKYPKLHIFPAENIYESDSLLFGVPSELFKNDQHNTIKDVRNYLLIMQKKYAPKMGNWLGFDDVCLPLAFEWGCPNQSPALLYMNSSKTKKNWQQLFSRRA
ncbi:hypothetical protein H4J63_05780 [Pseudoalteromonas sp. 5Ae-yellow]|uniref:phosphoribosyltransferase-like protein n=1 Tax=Pseudoalteromonas sp. 5Ae-yellow TaxID=2759847 RepID=UPI0015F39FCD|nr:hypothetical protein [Pseudoalteromonas sp. 5Ae-yellow]MBA6408860.1 hypothetical protein [Pseudoalteromonas sp. 5Ae-yellow]